jgi:hypothetical protein
MKTLNQVLALAGVAVALGLSADQLAAQGRRGGGGGNFDPAQFMQQRMDRYKEQLEVKSDDEWKIIQVRIEKVVSLQRDVQVGRRGGFGGTGGRRGGGDPAAADNNGRTNRFAMFAGEPNPDVEALQKALDAKASSEEIKGKLAKVRGSIKDKETNLVKAQEDLRKVLSVRQEAIAVLIGLLK